MKEILQGLLRPGQKWTMQRRIIPATRDGAQRSNRRVLQKKTVRRQSHQHALKEISSDQIRRTAVHLGCGSYGSCYLALLYRSIRVVVKELRVKQLQLESREEAEARVARELIYEARILNKLGDHPGLPLLFGVCTERAPYRLIMQFHGNQDGTSFTISTALSNKTNSRQDDLDKDHCQSSGSLSSYSRERLLAQ